MSITGMKLYTVHARPGTSMVEKPVFIKEGFNLWAFLLTVVWALYHRLWLVSLLLVAFNVTMFYCVRIQLFSSISFGILHLAFHVICGLYGNDWIRAKLTRRGYIMADITAGDSLLRAEQRYFERYLAAA